MEPSNVNLNALEIKFRTIFSHMPRSTKTGSPTFGHSSSKLQAGFLRGRAEYAREFHRESCEIGRLINRLHPACFNPREIEQRIDQAKQARAVAVHQFELAFGRRRQSRVALGK